MYLNDPKGLKVPSSAAEYLNTASRYESRQVNVLLLMFGSSKRGCFGVAMSWTILCVFCGVSHENRRSLLRRLMLTPTAQTSASVTGANLGTCKILLTVRLEALLSTEERTLDPEPTERASATVACSSRRQSITHLWHVGHSRREGGCPLGHLEL